MADTIEELEAEIRKISSQIFALHEKRNTDWRKLSNEEKQRKNAYMTERNSHSVEWRNLTASILIPVFKYAKIKFHKYQKNNSYSEKLMKTLQDCLLCFDKSKDTDFIHYLNRSLKRMFRSECQKQHMYDKLGGMTHIEKERADKTIARLGKNPNDENVKNWKCQSVLREYYTGQDGKEKSRLEETVDDRLSVIDERLSNPKAVKSILLTEIDKEEFSEPHRAIITHALIKTYDLSESDLVGHKFFSAAEYEALCKNPDRSQKDVADDYDLGKSAYNKVISRLWDKLKNRVAIKELKKAESDEVDDKIG